MYGSDFGMAIPLPPSSAARLPHVQPTRGRPTGVDPVRTYRVQVLVLRRPFLTMLLLENRVPWCLTHCLRHPYLFSPQYCFPVTLWIRGCWFPTVACRGTHHGLDSNPSCGYLGNSGLFVRLHGSCVDGGAVTSVVAAIPGPHMSLSPVYYFVFLSRPVLAK